MNVTTTNRHERRRARTRAAVLDAAEATFTLHGLEGSRIDAIADAADVSVGSIYSHFGSKDGLWTALAERALERFDRYLQQAYDPAWRPLDQVVACGDAYLRFHQDHPGSFRFLAFDGTAGRLPIDDPQAAARASARLEAIILGFEERIAAAMRAGEATHRDARLVARFLWAAWNGTVGLTLRADDLRLDEPELEACLEQARAIVMEGLAAPGHRHPDGSTRGTLHRIRPPADED
jgi:AcrR family transcriptional regulator